MNCRLCGHDKPLCDSHIVPELFYKPIYDEKHRIFARVGGELTKDKPLQKGLKEKLLCSDCDNVKLSKWEKYGHDLLYGKMPLLISQTAKCLSLNSIDYKNMRLLFLSILWRMSVASHPAWKEVSLGPHEDILKDMIVSEDPGKTTDFGFVCMIPLVEKRLLIDLIIAPDCVRAHSGRFYRIVLGGLLYMFFIGSTVFPSELNSYLIQPNGTWSLPIMNANDIEFLRKDFNKLITAARRGV